MLLPDSELDDGTVAIKYSEGSHQLVFTQPLLIAALAGAPCAEDLGQNLNDSCRTAFGRAVSSGTTSTQSTTVTGRLFAGFGAGAPVSNNSLEVTASISKTINRWTSTAYSLRSAACSCAPPFVSMDAPWCFDYGIRAGSNWEFPNKARTGIGQAANRFWC